MTFIQLKLLISLNYVLKELADDDDQALQLSGPKEGLFFRRFDGIELFRMDNRLIVDYLIEIASKFFYQVLTSLLDKEKTRLGAEAFNATLDVRIEIFNY